MPFFILQEGKQLALAYKAKQKAIVYDSQSSSNVDLTKFRQHITLSFIANRCAVDPRLHPLGAAKARKSLAFAWYLLWLSYRHRRKSLRLKCSSATILSPVLPGWDRPLPSVSFEHKISSNNLALRFPNFLTAMLITALGCLLFWGNVAFTHAQTPAPEYTLFEICTNASAQATVGKKRFQCLGSH